MKFFRRLIPYALVILALVLVFPLFCGCSGADTSNRFHELLKLVPSDINMSHMPLTLNDFASFWEDNNISLTTAENQPVTFEEYIDMIRQKDFRFIPGGSDIIGYGRNAVDGTIKDKYVGYNFTYVDGEIQASEPPHMVTAAIGRYDPQATREALSFQDEWPSWAIDAYTIEEYRGVTVHSWGDGFSMHMTDRLVPPHVDMLGRAMPLAVTDRYLFYTPNIETMKLMIDASQGKTESLADLPEFAEIADRLADFDVYSAIIGIESMVNGDPEYTGTYPGPRLKKFLTFGSASGKDEKGTYTTLVLYHESPDDAESNISLLEQRIANTDSLHLEIPWNEIIIDAEISVDGNVLLAKLYTDSLGLWGGLVYGRDILLLHEE